MALQPSACKARRTRPAACAGALQFRDHFDKAMEANEKLLAADEAAQPEEDEDEDEAPDASSKVSDLTDAIGKVRAGPPVCTGL